MSIKDLKVGEQLPSRSKVVTQERMTKYSDMLFSTVSGKRQSSGKNIHTDADFARAQGLPGTVADGMISTAWLSAMLVEFFGQGYLRGGKLTTTYTKPVYAGDKLTLKAIVQEKVPEGSVMRINLEVWCENQKGEKVTVGTASALVR